MFHISTLELALTCGLILLIFILPVIFSRWQAQVSRRLNELENKVEKKRR